uniref:Uncharacterized protein n=1 Tax=Anguilla anguilla TaxID=7936 RepID=A0A0E9W656_ANGAN
MIIAMCTGSSWKLSCRFRFILRILCCIRKLFSRANLLYWSSNWAKRSWNRTVARETLVAARSQSWLSIH